MPKYDTWRNAFGERFNYRVLLQSASRMKRTTAIRIFSCFRLMVYPTILLKYTQKCCTLKRSINCLNVSWRGDLKTNKSRFNFGKFGPGMKNIKFGTSVKYIERTLHLNVTITKPGKRVKGISYLLLLYH